MSTQDQVHKFAATILQNLPEVPEDIMQNWIENPKELQRLLAGINPPANGSTSEFKVFKTIKLGVGPTNANGFRKAIRESGMSVGERANDIIGKPVFTVATKETELDLVVVSVAELGLKNGVNISDIYARAKENGLQLCPNEVGPQLRLQYKNQPKNEWLVIGMEPIIHSGGVIYVFRVGRNGRVLWLSTRHGGPGSLWGGGDRFVFVLPRK